MDALPDWLRGEPPEVPHGLILASARGGFSSALFIRRALYRMLEAICRLAVEDGNAARPGFLRALHPGAKLLGFAILLLSLTLLQSFTALLLSLCGSILWALVSRVPASRLAWTWLSVPAFSAAIILPASLGWVSGGKPVVLLWGPLTVTDAGLVVASRFVLRSLACVSLVLLLTATTSPGRLLRGLRWLGLPKGLVFLLAMVIRYATVLLTAAEEIHLGKLSRTLRAGHLRSEQAWMAAGLGALYRRSRALAEGIHLAMVSRGYRGEARLLHESSWRMEDAAFLSASVALASGLLLIG